MSTSRACDDCLRRAWLLARLAGHLDTERQRIPQVLDFADEDLIEAVGGGRAGEVRAEWAAFAVGDYRGRCEAAGVEALCRCDASYPPALWDLDAEPAVLHVTGGLERFLELAAADGAAIVGARRASPYAMESARSLARDLAGRLTVVSGMASGVDAAAHEGALQAGGGTIAVLACSPERPYPPSARRLHAKLMASDAVVSELGPGLPARRWMFPARNRIIAALAGMTVVVAARPGSGAMLTVAEAEAIGRPVGGVPGQVTAPLSWGPHVVVRLGGVLVRDAGDGHAAGVEGDLCGFAMTKPARQPRAVRQASVISSVRLVGCMAATMRYRLDRYVRLPSQLCHSEAARRWSAYSTSTRD